MGPKASGPLILPRSSYDGRLRTATPSRLLATGQRPVYPQSHTST
jgi:hypothetical protein